MEISLKGYKTWAIIGGIVCAIVFLIYIFSPSCSNSYNNGDADNDTYDSAYYNADKSDNINGGYRSGSQQDNEDARAFRIEADVMNYLMGHSFSNNGIKLTFRPEGIFGNNTQLTRAISIRSVRPYNATINASLIYGDGGVGTYYLDSKAGTLTDSVGGDVYYAD